MRITPSIAPIACLSALLTVAASEPPASPSRDIELPLQVRAAPADVEFVIVSVPVDFGALLQERKMAGAVDERSLRLSRVTDGRTVPLQYRNDPQPRPKTRKFLPGSSPAASYLAEYAATEIPETKVAGRIFFIHSGADANYLLHFSVPQTGKFIQVPYPPQNLIHFDAENRAAPPSAFPMMQIRPLWPLQGRLKLFHGPELLTEYFIGPAPEERNPQFRRPFFYPVNGPDGISLTEYGKPHDPTGSHAHHYSLWIAHHDVNGQSFWSDKGGIIAHEAFDEIEDGPLFSRVQHRLRWIGTNGTTILQEKRTVTAYHSPASFRALDFDLEFKSASNAPVVLGQTTFGFLAARVAASMTVFDGGGEILTSEGARNEQAAHLSHGRWLDQSGPIAPDKWGGVTILDHPSNPHHPTFWHCRNDGWAGAAFNKEAPFTISTESPLRLRYRVILHSGKAKEAKVELRWKEFAAEPKVEWGKVK